MTKILDFFSLEKYIKKCGLSTKNQAWILALTAPRNIGKSTSGMNFVLEQYEKFGYKFIYTRTTGEQLKYNKQSFNQQYKDKYVMSDTAIYKLIDLKNGKTNSFKFERLQIATCAFMSVETKLKSSGDYADYKYLLWDEFNDLTLVPNLYGNLTNMVKTFQRFKKDFCVIMLGNKDTANNPFLVNWGIELESSKTDLIYEVDESSIYYVDVGIDTFAGLNQNEGLSNKLAKFDDKMNRYINEGGYRETGEKNIINYELRIKSTAKILYYIVANNTIFETGFFINKEEQQSLYLKIVEQTNSKYGIIICGAQNGINQDGNIANKEETQQMAELLFYYAKNSILYYTNYECKILADCWLSRELKKW